MHLTQLARDYGGKPAVIMAGSGAILSYAELDRQSNQIAQLFCCTRRGPPAGRRASCPR